MSAPRLFTVIFGLILIAAPSGTRAQIEHPGTHAASPVPALFDQAESVIARLESSLTEAIRQNDETAFLACFSLPDRMRQGLHAWFSQTSESVPEGAEVHTTLILPVLGVEPDRILITNGLLRVTHILPDSTLTQDLPLDAAALIRSGNEWSIAEPAGDELADRPGITVTAAVFSTHPRPDEQALSARAEFTCRNDGPEPLSVLPFYLRHALRFSDVSLAGRPVTGTMSTGTLGGWPAARLELVLDTPLPPGESRDVRFSWSTSFARHQFGRKPLGFTPDRGFILWESGWYPHPSTDFVMFPYRMEITAPAGEMALTSGTLTSRRETATGEVFSYTCELPGPPYLLWGHYRITTASIGEARVEIWTPVEGDIEPGPMQARLAEILTLYDRILPPPNLSGHRVVAVPRFGGYGPPGNLLLDDSSFAVPTLARPETIDLVAHELAHSWINSISQPGGELSLCLSEGLATYLGATAVAGILGSDDARAIWGDRQAEYQNVYRRTIPPAALNETIQHSDNAMFRAVTYTKSAFFLREMETLLGADLFFSGLQETLLAHSGGEFTFTDLIDGLTRAGCAVARECFSCWRDSRDLPDYAVCPADPESASPAVVVVNSGAPSPLPVRIAACDSAGTVIRHVMCTPVPGERLPLPFQIGDGIASIVVDPEVRHLQSESRNDSYPAWLLPVAEQAAIHAMLERFFRALRENDTTIASGLLTADRTLLSDSVRNRMTAFFAQGPHEMTPGGEGRCFATGPDRADIEIPVQYVVGGQSRSLTGVFSCVRESGEWRIAVFSVF